ncbi:NAD(P)/FAD-dependent oxidoreductase [Caulobacter endophyticus]|uniref:Thioredoxin reductase n=1 Tax=Caulobacter endophyticus TaxID=2172652 RepID=A0A2T9K9U0_9CAUL|nr:NAD(P)/FAD-dependent oxidoreductase [Caulobacter endophyticus]PVM92737.1 thioredoxin reductase [Caulobacter endophyticus]
MSDERIHCLIVGGGPAGLTAAIYLARFRLSVVVVDAGDSRAALIALTRNHAGFPEGISGQALLARMREQAKLYGARVISARVAALEIAPEDFLVRCSTGAFRARAVLLATGVTNRRPPMDETLHARALAQGRLRYCPVCDGFEVTDQRVAVIGGGARAAGEAEFLRAYTSSVTLIALEADDGLDESQRRRLDEIGVRRIAGPAGDFALEDDSISLACSKGRLRFDAVYPALGSEVHSDLASGLGAAVTEDGCIRVDAHQRTSIEGLYAAGDVVLGLDQISHAMGEAGVAATALRNDLAKQALFLR